jgi:spore coat protein CotH
VVAFIIGVLSYSIINTTSQAAYETKLFDETYVHQIDIIVPESDWDDMQAEPREKDYFTASASIDGDLVKNIGFRIKGSSSLKYVQRHPGDGSQKYSLKLNFDKYDKQGNYFGLDGVDLNNEVHDPSFMKEFVSYNLLRNTGVPTPLTSFTKVTVNGEDMGVYFVVENYGDSFVKRNRMSQNADLFKPNARDLHGLSEQEAAKYLSQGWLNYDGDDFESYNDLWGSSVFKIGDTQKKRIIGDIKRLSSGGIRSATNVDELAKYFAVSNFVINDDSYTSTVGHNFFIAHSGSKFQILPWDYNMTFGIVVTNLEAAIKSHELGGEDDPFTEEEFAAFVRNATGSSPGQVAQIINKKIDLLDGGKTCDKVHPLFCMQIADKDLRKNYHEKYGKLLDYVQSPEFTSKLNDTIKMITPAVQADPKKTFDNARFDQAIDALTRLINLRAQATRMQVNGEITTGTAEDDIGKSYTKMPVAVPPDLDLTKLTTVYE